METKKFRKQVAEYLNIDESNLKSQSLREMEEAYDKIYYNKTDEEIYKNLQYFLIAYSTYVHRTKNLIKNLSTLNLDVESILDFGGGTGLSTLHLSQIFPNAKIYYYDISPLSEGFAKKLFEGNDNIEIVNWANAFNTEKKIDLIFCNEVLEHIYRLSDILDVFNKKSRKYLVLSNSFNLSSAGIKEFYEINNVQVPKASVPKKYTDYLKSLGWSKMKTTFWNSRPTVFVRE